MQNKTFEQNASFDPVAIKYSQCYLHCGVVKAPSSQIPEQHVSFVVKRAAGNGTFSSVMPNGARKPVEVTIIVPVSYRMAHGVLKQVLTNRHHHHQNRYRYRCRHLRHRRLVIAITKLHQYSLKQRPIEASRRTIGTHHCRRLLRATKGPDLVDDNLNGHQTSGFEGMYYLSCTF